MTPNTWVILKEGEEETEHSIRVRVSENLIVLQSSAIPFEDDLRGRIIMAQMRFNEHEWIAIANTIAAALDRKPDENIVKSVPTDEQMHHVHKWVHEHQAKPQPATQ